MPIAMSLGPADIRSRHGVLTEKLRALNTAVNEHFRNIKVRMDHGELTRPSSSVYRVPMYVTLLCRNLDTEVVCLRSDLNQFSGKAAKCPKEEYVQLDRLVTDLENQFKVIKQKITTKRFDASPPPQSPREKTGGGLKNGHRVTNHSPRRPWANGEVTTSKQGHAEDDKESITDTCSTITLPRLDHIAPVGKQRHRSEASKTSAARSSSMASDDSSMKNLTPIEQSKTSPDKKGILKTSASITPVKGTALPSAPTMSVPPRTNPVVTREPTTVKSFTAGENKAKRVTFDQNTKDRLANKEKWLQRQPSNLGYPYGSSFPALPPLPSKRRFVSNVNSPAVSKGLSTTLSANAHYKKERQWMC